MLKQIKTYFKAHPTYNSFVHILIGIGLGVLLTHPVFGGHTLRWGVGLVVLGLLGHLYPLLIKKRFT